MNITRIPAFASAEIFHVVVESPRGSRLKLKYEPKWQTMSISRPLPLGIAFPFDWGFVPSTHAADGDPLDAMALWDVPSYPGVVLQCRAIGVLQIEQNRTKGRSRRVRNDRIMAIPVEARREHGIATVDDLSARVRQELEQFALAAAALEGKDVQVVGWGSADIALKLVRKSSTRARR
jgi:inorganic pyrophosphatase